METKELNLYKVYAKGWNSPAYVAAINQDDAINKVAEFYTDQNPTHFNVEYISDIFV